MKITKLQLENFRNYETYKFDFKENCTILVGENGRGKTNFLEAIYVLSLGRTFRNSGQDCLIEWEKDFLRCKCEFIEQDHPGELEVFYTNTPRRHKSLKKNGVKMRSSQYIGNLLTVFFHPEDLNLLYLSPSLRRKYLDTMLCQTHKEYLQALSNYRKVLRHRNSFLQDIKKSKYDDHQEPISTDSLATWDLQLVEYGSQISQIRHDLIEFLNNRVQDYYQKISGKEEHVELIYKCKALQYMEDPDFEFNKESLQQEFQNALDQRQPLDIIRGVTSIGPHRDDIEYYINHKNISDSASRGEFRTLLLALKLAEIEFIKEKTEKNPILLLDDVFSELDYNRQKHLLEAIKGCQTIITTTDLQGLEEVAKTSRIINIGGYSPGACAI